MMLFTIAMFISPIVYKNRNRSTGICQPNCSIDTVSIKRIYHIHNTSKLIHFYESPNISILDKLKKMEDYDFENSPGFHIKKGGLFDDFEEFFTTFFFL